MKEYYFTYNNVYGQQMGILSTGKNREEAREKIPFPCTYRYKWTGGPSWMIDTRF